MSVDLSTRAADARELMDDPGADRAMLARTYDRFAFINAVVSRWRPVYRQSIRPRRRTDMLRILDIGAGGGDVSRSITAWASRDRMPVEITALDIDARAIEWARAYDPHGRVEYRCDSSRTLADAGERFDVVLSNHLLHHLSAQQLQDVLADSVRLLAPGGVALHRDIARSRFAYRAFAAYTMPLARSFLAGSFIRADGLTSIRRAYTAPELAAAAPPGWAVERAFPARLGLRWEKPHD